MKTIRVLTFPALPIVLLLICMGCISTQPQQKTQYVYVCDDGKQVSDPALCNRTNPSQPEVATTQTNSDPDNQKRPGQNGGLKNNSQKQQMDQTKPGTTRSSQPDDATTQPKNNANKPKKQNQTGGGQKNDSNKQPKNQTRPKNDQATDDNGPPMSGEIKVPTDELNAQLAGNLLLGRPTSNSIDVSILAVKGMEAYCEYGTSSGAYTQKTAAYSSANAEPIVLTIGSLAPDTEYYYRAQMRKPNEAGFSPGPQYSFRTQRQTGESFSFAVQADPHRAGHTDENLYKQTLQNELAARPDFLIDLGDTFMTEKFATNDDQVVNRYLQDRGFFGIVAGSVPLFDVNGNHDGEFGWEQDGTANNDAVWATLARKTYFLPPYPNTFYSGSNTSEPVVGVRASYYAWQWGDALFVTLDPYGYTKTDPKVSGNEWDWTLGGVQYHWLERTLENSHAKYKFIFEHHLIGDLRGSVYWAPYYEWGGKNRDGSWGFTTNRPGWGLPIHQLMVKNNVTIFFQGHDHLFDKDELDGIVYQEVPQPGNANAEAAPGAEYNYKGVTLPSSGYLLVNVSSDNVTVAYMKTVMGQQPQVAYTYSINK